jgi:hopanoid biosynthesis associated RND transporter like protein HpnN
MSAKGTLPEAGSPSRDARDAPLTNLAQLFVGWTSRHPLKIIIAFVFLTALAGLYVVRHFSINTDVNALISADLPWRQRELAYEAAFPQSTQGILAVVDAPTPELADAAATALADHLSQHDGLFRSVEELGGGRFFESNALLFLDMPDLTATLTQLEGASPSLAILAADPSLRGLIQAFSLSLGAAQMGMFDSMPQTLNQLADTVESVLAGRPTSFSWKDFLQSEPAKPGDRRRLIAIWPKLDFSSLEPGRQATAAIREAGERANLASDFRARLRLTGPVPIVDQEFATLQQGALLNGVVTAALVLLILWLALRSFKIVLAVSLTLGAGLAITAAVGLLIVGAFNPISLAFAVLCVGLGADFAIQFSVRYRAERHTCGELRKALALTGLSVGLPLTLAAASAAAGFMSFLPTDYIGMAELGVIAGFGMGIAYLTSMLLLPALLQTFGPPREPYPLGYAAMAPVDQFLGRHRMAVVVATTLVVAAGLPLLPHLRFDFNPLDLRNPNEEAMTTYSELSQDPVMNANLMEVLTASPDAAADVAKRLSTLPQVGQARTIDTFVPDDQAGKIAAIKSAPDRLDGVLNPAQRPAPPTDADNIAALKSGAQNLLLLADAVPGPGGDAAKRFAADLDKLAAGPPNVRASMQTVLTQPLAMDLEALRHALRPEGVTRTTLPEAIRRSWVSPDGGARVELVPKAGHEFSAREFAQAVMKAEPTATGPAIGELEWGATIIHAFVLAGACALLSIAVLLWIALRRVSDVLLTLVPLLVAAVVTLEVCALLDFPLNYANIIALPVLLGVGVAFKIYYVMAWRSGQSDFLQSPLTRAVLFSALMTATAFGSLSFSSHPGTASMGKLLALSLACTLASAALFQPALMGKPRRAQENA